MNPNESLDLRTSKELQEQLNKSFIGDSEDQMI